MKTAQCPTPRPELWQGWGEWKAWTKLKRIPENRFIQLPNCFESRPLSLGSFDFIANESKSFAIQLDPY